MVTLQEASETPIGSGLENETERGAGRRRVGVGVGGSGPTAAPQGRGGWGVTWVPDTDAADLGRTDGPVFAR